MGGKTGESVLELVFFDNNLKDVAFQGGVITPLRSWLGTVQKRLFGKQEGRTELKCPLFHLVELSVPNPLNEVRSGR